MGFNSLTNIESCYWAVQQSPSILYYAHIPTAIAALIIGIFVLIKNPKQIISKVLFGITISFSLWTLLDLVIWTSYDSRKIMVSWALLGFFNSLFFILSVYLVYLFVDKRDLSIFKKTIFILLILPLLIFMPTNFNLKLFSDPDCEATEGFYFTNYYYFLGLLSFVWILWIIFDRYRKRNNIDRKQLLILGFGVESFLLIFSLTGFLNSFLVAKGMITDVNGFNLEQYGLFGMPIFMGFLAYLIVQYKAFNIQLLKAQALVVGLFILIGSQFFFIQNNTNRILNGITLFLSGSFGWWLVRSVKEEVKRKEQLEIISKQLANANIKLKRLDEAKTEFISIASHQLRTPLTSIKGFISLIFEGLYGKYSDQIKDVLEKVYISNERLIKLVEDLLNISRIDSGRMTFQFEKNSITEVVNEVFSTMEMVAENKKLKLEYKKPTKDIGDLIFDKVKIREVISNFVDNAIKYTQSGFVQLELKELPETVQVVVSDSGVGIDKEDIKGIFEKFRRGREIGKIHSDGAGLGLYFCLKIANAHNAKVWAESEGKGKGSRFILELRKDFEGKDKQS